MSSLESSQVYGIHYFLISTGTWVGQVIKLKKKYSEQIKFRNYQSKNMDVSDLGILLCPECKFDTKEENNFEDH